MFSKTFLYLSILVALCHLGAQSQNLRVGNKAPDIQAVNTNGDSIKLSNMKGQKVYVAFLRYAGCPVCNFRTHDLILHFDSINAKGYKIIAIYESSNSKLKEYLTDTPVPFTVIGNPDLSLYKSYGVQKSFWKTLTSAFKRQPNKAMRQGKRLFARKYKRDGSLTRLPADFIIDENGLIKVAYYGSNIGDHLPIKEILNY